ncbi:MAG TPA: dephospho-CoA kinase [bacterium]|nr:dephospho-CoA kinase [bacterium]
MKIVGLTGGIGSGKSTVARMFVDRGARLIDADQLARDVVLPQKPAWNDIVREFGEAVLLPDRAINREALAAIVFADQDKRKRLNDITHPRIGQEMLRLAKQFTEQGAPLAVIDAALLLESPATKWIKPVIVVVADEAVKLERVCARDRCDQDEVLQRIRAQWPDSERVKYADYVIDNSGTLEDLKEQVEKVWRQIIG